MKTDLQVHLYYWLSLEHQSKQGQWHQNHITNGNNLAPFNANPFYDNNNNNNHHRMMKGFNNNNRKRKGNFNSKNILIMNHPFQLHATAIAMAVEVDLPTIQLWNPLTQISVENLPRVIRLLSFWFCESNGKKIEQQNRI